MNASEHIDKEIAAHPDWRAIKIFQGDKVNASGLKKLLRAAVAFNAAKGTRKARPPAKATRKTTKGARTTPKAKGAAARGARSKR